MARIGPTFDLKVRLTPAKFEGTMRLIIAARGDGGSNSNQLLAQYLGVILENQT